MVRNHRLSEKRLFRKPRPPPTGIKITVLLNIYFDWRQGLVFGEGVSRPLSALFLDCDSFFASVEQQLDPALRGRPVGVAPVMAESTCCIAASYEAKRHGVKTGTRVSDARAMCPGIRIVEAKPAEYVRVHHRVIAAVEDCIHVEAVLSIDEMWAWLPLNWRSVDHVMALGRRIKARVAEHAGECIRVSVGAAPNRYLAKLASKMRKPDGLFLIEEGDLPEVLHELALRDLTGVAQSMEARLHATGIHTVEALCAAAKHRLHAAWGGVLGDRMYHHLRGDIVPDLVTVRKSLGHSHVLPPDSRTPERAWPIVCKLLHKAGERLRSHQLLAGGLTLHAAISGEGEWTPEIRFGETDSTLVLMRMLARLWRERPAPRAPLIQVGVTLTRLIERGNHTPDLFAGRVADLLSQDDRHRRLDECIDRLRARYGRQCVYFGTVQDSRDQAPMRISFTHIPDLGLESDRS
jgi:DNA polymerase-4